MNIGLIDVDSHNFPNLPLMKLSAYHKGQGDHVEPWLGLKTYDKVYMSKVFPGSREPIDVIMADEIIRSGTGYYYPDGGETLLEEIEHTCPDYSLYPTMTTDKAYGFLTRGCPMACPFCIVSQKEGKTSQKVADLDEFWREQREIKLLDPNLLACSEREVLLKQLADSRAYVDFTQGLDIRLVGDVIGLLDQIRIARIHFAWDNPNQDLRPYFKDYIRKARSNKHRPPSVYVLTNYGSTVEQDLYRIYTLRDLGFDPYVMIYDKENAPRDRRLLQRWVNNKIIFRTVEKFEDYNCKIG